MKNRTRIFLVLSVVIAIIDGAFVLLNNTLTTDALYANLKQEGQRFRSSYDTLLSQTYTNMLAMATYISHDKEVQALFLAGKQAVEAEGGGPGGREAAAVRKKLFDKVGPNWIEVQKSFQVRQLHFHLGPGSTSFLRVHQPDKFGDNMDDVRFTVVDTNAEQSPRTGFETGRVYSGLRGVVPVSAWDADAGKTVHVGALEVGTSFDVMLNILDERYDIGTGIFLTMDHVTSTMWPDFIKQRFDNGMDECDCVAEAYSRDGIGDIVHGMLGNGSRLRGVGTEIVRVENTFYAVSRFPLRDYLGNKDQTRDAVGAVLFWRNADTQMAAYNRSHLFNIIYGVLGFLVIEVLLFFTFRYAVRHLEKEVAQRTTELSESESRLSDAQRIAHLGNWDWNVVDNELWWSDEIYRIFGIPPHAFKATSDAFIEIIHPDDRALVMQAIEAALHDNKPYNIEHKVILPDGSERDVHEQAEVISDKSGTPVRMIGTVLDITERKKVKQKLDALNEKLRYEVEVKNKFFSIIAHDLKSPFNALLGMTDMMANMSDSFSKEDLAEYAMHTNKAGKQVFELLQNLLDWSLMQMEGEAPEQKMVPLRDLAQKSIEVLKPVALQKEIALINELQDTSVFSDPNMVETVIRNLVANALKFTPSGGSVKVSALQNGDMVQVIVADTGVGMSQEQMENIFALDQKTSTTGTAGEEGTGLGLPLCKEMVEKNGGRIWVESAPGEGSAFTFTMRASSGAGVAERP